MKQSVRLLAVLAVLAVVPAVLPPYYVTLLNYIGGGMGVATIIERV